MSPCRFIKCYVRNDLDDHKGNILKGYYSGDSPIDDESSNYITDGYARHNTDMI